MKNQLIPVLTLSLAACFASSAYARVTVNGEAFDSATLTAKGSGSAIITTTPPADEGSIPAILKKAEYVVSVSQLKPAELEVPGCVNTVDTVCKKIQAAITIDPIGSLDRPVPINCQNPDRADDPACHDPDPEPSPCGTVGAELVFEELDWANLPTKKTITTGIVGAASRFTTSLSPTYKGYFEVTSTTESVNYYRRLWFSECPGGPPIETNYMWGGVLKNACDKNGVEFAINWSQETNPLITSTCELQHDTTYYLNYKQYLGVGDYGPTAISTLIRGARSSGSPTP